MKSLISIANQDILNRIHKWQTGGSPWSVKAVHSHKLNVNKYRPLKGGSKLPIPEKVQNSMKGLINMKNLNDDECFRWCYLAFKFPAKKKPQRITKYKEHIDKLGYSGDSFPVTMKMFHELRGKTTWRLMSSFGLAQTPMETLLIFFSSTIKTR